MANPEIRSAPKSAKQELSDEIVLYAPFRTKYIPGYLIEMMQTAYCLRTSLGTQAGIRIILVDVSPLDALLAVFATPRGVTRRAKKTLRRAKKTLRRAIQRVRPCAFLKRRTRDWNALDRLRPSSLERDVPSLESVVAMLESYALDPTKRAEVQASVVAGKSTFLPDWFVDELGSDTDSLISRLLLGHSIEGDSLSIELLPVQRRKWWVALLHAFASLGGQLEVAKNLCRNDSVTVALATIRFRGVRIGDLAASTALAQSENGGRLTSLRQARTSLLRCSALAHCALSIPIHHTSFVTGVEPMYANWTVVRALELRGARPFARNGAHRYQFIQGDLTQDAPNAPLAFRENRIVPKLSAGEVDKEALTETIRHIERERSTSQYLLVATTANDPPASLQRVVDAWFANDQTVFVIYIHDMRDGQLCFGITDIGDLGTWLKLSVDLILRDASSRALIRLHPMDPSGAERANQVALSRLMTGLTEREIERVRICRGDINLGNLLRGRPHVAFTHHGSVAVSSVADGNITIASVTGPWGWRFPFLYTWGSREELARLVVQAQQGTLPAPTGEQNLKEFVYSYRIKKSSEDVHHFLFSLLFKGCKSSDGTVEFWLVNELLHRFSADALLRTLQDYGGDRLLGGVLEYPAS